jgi:hypothetical protein
MALAATLAVAAGRRIGPHSSDGLAHRAEVAVCRLAIVERFDGDRDPLPTYVRARAGQEGQQYGGEQHLLALAHDGLLGRMTRPSYPQPYLES